MASLENVSVMEETAVQLLQTPGPSGNNAQTRISFRARSHRTRHALRVASSKQCAHECNAPLGLCRDAAPIELYRDAAPSDLYRDAVPIDLCRDAAPIDLCRDAAPIDWCRDTAPIDFFRDAAPIDLCRDAAPILWDKWQLQRAQKNAW